MTGLRGSLEITIVMVQILNDGRTYADGLGFSFLFSSSNDSGISRVRVILIKTILLCIFRLSSKEISFGSIHREVVFEEIKW